MNILITGGSGFLGRRAAAYLSSLGHHILTPAHTELDITNKAGIDTWFQEHLPDAVIHCAAVSDTGLCQREPEHSHQINVTGSVNLAEACTRTGAKFLFCSSDQVYAGSSLPGPHSETEILIPQTVYGRQKHLAEQLCHAACPSTVSLRLSWMYSTQFLPGEHSHLLITLCNSLKDPSLPFAWSAHDYRGITNTDDVVRNLSAALNLPAGVYNFGSGNDTDMYHTMQTVFTALDLQDALSRMIPNQQSAPRDIRMDGTLAASYGITFEPTCTGLFHALQQYI